MDDLFKPAKDGRLRVVIADDDLAIQQHLKQFIEPTFEVVGIACNGRELVEAVDRYLPEIVVSDIAMPELNGIQAVKIIKAKHPDVQVVLLSVHTDKEIVDAAIAAGASAYIVKVRAATELIPAMNLVVARSAVTPVGHKTER